MLFSQTQDIPEKEFKSIQRAARLNALPASYHESFDFHDKAIISSSSADIIANVRSGQWSAVEVIRSFGKQALHAHRITNCLTEIMLADAESWAHEIDTNDEKRKFAPLAGMPISLKDTANVKGYDSCIGYPALVNKPAAQHSPLVQLLLDAGAIPFVKTNIPITLLSFESSNPVFGRTLNPFSPKFTSGGSSGGESALIACGGSRIGIGTDVAGSVRVPAHYCGIYTIRASAGRFPKAGNTTSLPGQEGVPAVYSPMARTLGDLETAWRGIMSMKPWEYDHSVIPLPWREVRLGSKVKFGVMWDDGVVPPTPACRRALNTVITSLRKAGHEVVDFEPPSTYRGLQIGAQLLLDDGFHTASKLLRPGELNDPGVSHYLRWHALPAPLKHAYALYTRHIARDPLYAGFLDTLASSSSSAGKTIEEYWALIAERETYRAEWAQRWREEGIEFLVCVPSSLPALPHEGIRHGFKNCGYTFLFNILDYPAGVLPVTKVDKHIDALSPADRAFINGTGTGPLNTNMNGANTHGNFANTNTTPNRIAQQAYAMYDADLMHNLPVGVQIVGQRLEEERVLEGMKLVEWAMGESGVRFVR